MGIKLGKLLKIDAITSFAIRGHFARLCVQIDIKLAKRIKIGTFCRFEKKKKIGTFWQDIVYENLPILCY